ncbi:hypothetical protein PAEPH01_2677, partial [Pancytospora epiphaga]
MVSCYQFSIFIILYTIFYYKKHVYVPKMYSASPLMKTFAFTTVYPFYLIPYGFVQSVYQLFRRVKIMKDTVYKSVILPLGDDAEVLLDIYEMNHKVSNINKMNHKESNINKMNQKESGSMNKRQKKQKESIDQTIKHNALLIHGLNGTSRSTYIRGMTNVFLKRNCRVF